MPKASPNQESIFHLIHTITNIILFGCTNDPLPLQLTLRIRFNHQQIKSFLLWLIGLADTNISAVTGLHTLVHMLSQVSALPLVPLHGRSLKRI